MKLALIGYGVSNRCDVVELKDKSEFRRATENMMMCYAAAARALATCTLGDPERVALVLASGQGERGVTMEFLSTLALTGVARPFLFQSSLHNATIGFLSMHLRVSGPTVTIANRYHGAESALDTASQLLDGHLADQVLVIGVDSRVAALEPPLAKSFPEIPSPGEGAGAMLLERESSQKALAVIRQIEIEQCRECAISATPSGFYEANGIENLIKALSSHNSSPLYLMKPDGTRSAIHWS